MSYDYKKTLKLSDSYRWCDEEIVNLLISRPLANLIVRVVYPTSVSPNHLTFLSLIAGLTAALLIICRQVSLFIVAALFVLLKDVLDSADGQLARARQQYTRFGRFFDSLVDVMVNAVLFIAIGIYVMNEYEKIWLMGLASLAFLSTTLRVSYHVYYMVSFLHLKQQYTNNRLNEEIINGDENEGRGTVLFQKLYLFLYGWQDRLMEKIDRWCARDVQNNSSEFRTMWYSDSKGLFLSNFLGIGTELFILALFVAGNILYEYLLFNIVILNVVWLLSISYRKYYLYHTVQQRLKELQ